ncbi:50S ribosomal protein L21 [soil metagenome]
MYAVIANGGKQYRVASGQNLKLEKFVAEVGTTVEFEKVLMIVDGESVRVGAPYIDGSQVSASVVSHGRADKIRVTKFKRRKSYHRTIGHRQYYTEVKITDIKA